MPIVVLRRRTERTEQIDRALRGGLEISMVQIDSCIDDGYANSRAREPLRRWIGSNLVNTSRNDLRRRARSASARLSEDGNAAIRSHSHNSRIILQRSEATWWDKPGKAA